MQEPLEDSRRGAPAAYYEAVAAFTDPDDFAPYTGASLDAHTAAMETLTAAFDSLAAAFAALDPEHDLDASAVAVYKAASDTYTFAANAYAKAASCAMSDALKGNVQAVKDKFTLTLLEDKATNAATDAFAAKTKAATFKAKSTQDARNAKALEEKARVAEGQAEAFLAKAKAAEAKAKEFN